MKNNYSSTNTKTYSKNDSSSYKNTKSQQPSPNLFNQFGQYAAIINQINEKGGMNFDPKAALNIFSEAFPTVSAI